MIVLISVSLMSLLNRFRIVQNKQFNYIKDSHSRKYTGYAGWAVTAGIPVKFGTAHGISRPEVGSMKCIDAYGRKGVSQPSLVIVNSYHTKTAHTDLLRPNANFLSLTMCRLD